MLAQLKKSMAPNTELRERKLVNYSLRPNGQELEKGAQKNLAFKSQFYPAH